ncbi:HlyD family efflux transporter periplasmic adaptor subunit [Clostridium sp. NSJ-6]|uniref:HlyD family efflux transporter periplasmic adaptor subunit n=1 Tax=Clostridium hominis TaxID=2763036 RepID=A0ABR7DCP8_9CLOT|nr:biotin/lipoyl-binding protein [Clostridium hominis]MBC5629166.1 HlyD family efflux transporter periplasmic adaptor subunit [Clostridium hominis]MDU2671773.1 HlyD family efflux transporter periplasmic adaptor subunit [Clostridium sp.]
MKQKVKKIINFEYVKKGKDTLQKKAVKYLGAFLLIMIGCTMLSRFADSLTIPVIKTEKPKVKTMVDEVKASGRVVKNREEKISIIEGLKIEYVNVSIGTLIKTGDVLVELNTEALQKKIDEINENISSEEKTLARAKEDYNRAIASKNSNVSNALEEMNKAKKALEDYQALPEEEKDKAMEESLKGDYESKKSMHASAVAEANDTVDLDRTLQDVKDSLKLDEYYEELGKLQPLLDANGKVTSPKEGIVTSVFAENGGVTSDAVVSIADKESGYKFVGQIESSKRTTVKQGQTVALKLSSGGYVENLTIEAISKSEESADFLNVTVVLPAGTGEIDDTGEIIISSQAKKYSTCVPLAALRQGENNSYYVLAVGEKETVLGSEKVARKYEVQIEKKDNEFAALKEGSFSRSEQVIISSNKTVEDGDRVRLETE